MKLENGAELENTHQPGMRQRENVSYG